MLVYSSVSKYTNTGTQSLISPSKQTRVISVIFVTFCAVIMDDEGKLPSHVLFGYIKLLSHCTSKQSPNTHTHTQRGRCYNRVCYQKLVFGSFLKLRKNVRRYFEDHLSHELKNLVAELYNVWSRLVYFGLASDVQTLPY